ncbi:MAG: acyl carrier protein [Tenuifilaceae bacterium]|jgi:acyl carrier protein|uniref:acyl carrier protein n=1 Tax=Perlabentimonas gracilis TaxID=2715279 RepID=UPI001409219E|nr:acyl carrier protein [Perlabentimonas gracilis]MDX9769847.1 acyl carrier protein [Tenuifilaceae bacterium]NHB68679.1 acyl carrier protein [Perlabentimonas gracilis]
MSVSEIYNKVKWLLLVNFNVKDIVNYYNADLKKDLGMDSWDVNMLLYLVESNFNVRFSSGTEKDIARLDQLVSLVYEASKASQRLKQIA